MKIAISNDHGGTKLKMSILKYLKGFNYDVINLGTDNNDSVDYPDYAYEVSKLLKDKVIDFGILICGSGIGISIAANRYPHVRAALCNDENSAELSRSHNNANTLVFGGRLIDHDIALKCINKFLNTEFEGGRHIKRVDKLSSPPII
ncbi:MAG: ribose 5-phosphate isomerase B [SAR116 cluster bacterium]|nr:ribose 5-phosphate isomerase B [SAR116 cluster bacterium]